MLIMKETYIGEFNYIRNEFFEFIDLSDKQSFDLIQSLNCSMSLFKDVEE